MNRMRRVIAIWFAVLLAGAPAWAKPAGSDQAAGPHPPGRAADPHERDMAALREWHYRLKPVPDSRGVGDRLAAWVKLHPNDAEALFFRYRLDLYDAASKTPESLARLRHSAELGFG